MIKIMVSACLLGQRVRYDGGHCAQDADLLGRWRAEGRLVAFCPEVAGGLGTPRPPAQIVGGDGDAVLDGRARVLTQAGDDVTQAFLRGAEALLDAARRANAPMALLKSKSPSCASLRIHDGTFSPTPQLVDGAGVSAALLRRNGIAVFNEHQLELAADFLARLEQSA